MSLNIVLILKYYGKTTKKNLQTTYVVSRHGKMGGAGSGQVNRVTSHWSKWVILSGLKRIRVNRVAGRIDPYFSHEFFFFIYKENNMYLLFGKLCNKLLDIKCIILNSPLISRINSVKLINTYSIILTLYKS